MSYVPRINLSRHPVSARVSFASLEEWSLFARSNPRIFNREEVGAIASRIASNGFTEPLTGRHVEAASIENVERSFREGFGSGRIISRHRATLALLQELCRPNPETFALYAAEGVTALAKLLSEHFPKFIGSEYAPDEETQKRIAPVPHQDLTALTFPDASLDAILTQDVLEHIPDLDACLREMARTLKPGGWSINTHPFLLKEEATSVRATMAGREVIHLQPAEYHGNPVNPEGGSLVFNVPGWDILRRARMAGFSVAEVFFVVDERLGVIADTCGVYLTCFRR